MKTLTRSLALALAVLAACSVALASDFPKGSPKFEDSLRAALSDAKKNGKPVVAVFSAVWCGPCQTMKNNVYPSDAVKAYHDKFNWAYLDTDNNRNARDGEKFGVSGIPHIQFLDAAGKPIDKQVGSSSPEAFAQTLEGVLKKAGAGATAAAAEGKK
jgi:thioredoxin-like negative regulator of GroEL